VRGAGLTAGTQHARGVNGKGPQSSSRDPDHDEGGSESEDEEEDPDLTDYCRALHAAYGTGHMCELLNTLR